MELKKENGLEEVALETHNDLLERINKEFWIDTYGNAIKLIPEYNEDGLLSYDTFPVSIHMAILYQHFKNWEELLRKSNVRNYEQMVENMGWIKVGVLGKLIAEMSKHPNNAQLYTLKENGYSQLTVVIDYSATILKIDDYLP